MPYIWILIMLSIVSCGTNRATNVDSPTTTTETANQSTVTIPDTFDLTPIKRSAEEWKSELSDIEYYVLREEGTERSFTGDLWDNKKEGIYTCRGCGLPLFDSATKYKSGTGWPSFYQPIKPEHVGEDTDYKIGYARTEVHCARCGGHLGHVFPDGPKPTGLRYCMNSVSMDFVERQKGSGTAAKK